MEGIWGFKGGDEGLWVIVGECDGIWCFGGRVWKPFACMVCFESFFDGVDLVWVDGSSEVDGDGGSVTLFVFMT